MGIKFQLSESFTDTTLPFLFDDVGMSPGTLALFDPANSKGAFTGVPANSLTVPNIARDVASGIVGAAPSALDFAVSAMTDGANMLRTERTSKGGVHVLPSQVNQITANNYWLLRLSPELRQFLFDLLSTTASTTAGIYASVWSLRTREQGSGNTAPQSISHITNQSSATGNYMYHMQGGVPNSGGLSIGRNVGDATLGAPRRSSSGVSGWAGTKPASTSLVTAALIGAGSFDGWASLNINKAPGFVLYRAKIEHLGLTKRANGGAGGTLAEEFAAAEAQDIADFNAAFSAGGKFYQDVIPTLPANFA